MDSVTSAKPWMLEVTDSISFIFPSFPHGGVSMIWTEYALQAQSENSEFFLSLKSLIE